MEVFKDILSPVIAGYRRLDYETTFMRVWITIHVIILVSIFLFSFRKSLVPLIGSLVALSLFVIFSSPIVGSVDSFSASYLNERPFREGGTAFLSFVYFTPAFIEIELAFNILAVRAILNLLRKKQN